MGWKTHAINDHVVRVAMKRGDCKRRWQYASVATRPFPSNNLFGQAPECEKCEFRLSCIADNNASAALKVKDVLPCSRRKRLTCGYHTTNILSVDLSDRRITCHDTRRISISTGWNIDAFKQAAQSYLKEVPEWVWREFEHWTQKHYWSRYVRSAALKSALEQLEERFDAPWRINGWFYWHNFDKELAESFVNSVSFLHKDLNYRYFTFNWTDGVWGYHFIDADAKRRWTNRQKKRSRNGNVRRPVHGDADGAPGDGRDA